MRRCWSRRRAIPRCNRSCRRSAARSASPISGSPIAYTWSAVLWVLLAPFWAGKSDHHGRKALTLLGLGGFIVSMFLCGLVLMFGLKGAIGGGLTFILFGLSRAIYGASAALRRRRRRPISPRGPGAAGASPPCRHCRRRSASARSSGRRWRLCSCCRSWGCPGPLFAFSLIGLLDLRRDPAVAAQRPIRPAHRVTARR